MNERPKRGVITETAGSKFRGLIISDHRGIEYRGPPRKTREQAKDDILTKAGEEALVMHSVDRRRNRGK